MIKKLGFIGGGNMAEAIVRAAIKRDVLKANQIIVSDPTDARRDVFTKLDVAVTADNTQVIAECEQIMLAVKPQVFPMIASELAKVNVEKQIVISIMAGLSTHAIAEVIGGPVRVIRTMPNTPLMTGVGMTGVSLGENVREGDETLTLELFKAGGRAVVVQENQLDAITAVSGSGPAYIFYLAEAMEEAARELGLEEHAALLVEQTVLGGAHLLVAAKETPAELRSKVSSPGGTTEAAITHMESNSVRRHIADAIAKAEARSRELGEG